MQLFEGHAYPRLVVAECDGGGSTRACDVTRTSTDMPRKASVIPIKLPTTGTACRISRATATGMRLKPPTLRLVGSKVIQPAPGTKTSAQAWVDPAPADPTML